MTEECLLAAMALNPKRMVSAICLYLKIYLFCRDLYGFRRNFCLSQQVQSLTAPSEHGLLRPFVRMASQELFAIYVCLCKSMLVIRVKNERDGLIAQALSGLLSVSLTGLRPLEQ